MRYRVSTVAGDSLPFHIHKVHKDETTEHVSSHKWEASADGHCQFLNNELNRPWQLTATTEILSPKEVVAAISSVGITPDAYGASGLAAEKLSGVHWYFHSEYEMNEALGRLTRDGFAACTSFYDNGDGETACADPVPKRLHFDGPGEIRSLIRNHAIMEGWDERQTYHALLTAIEGTIGNACLAECQLMGELQEVSP